jgi:hypothetical protein
MAIIVHDGTATADYNSYASVAAADAFHVDRATSEWASADSAAKTAALIRATDYLDGAYSFTCDRLKSDAVNPALVKATCAMAVHALASTLAEARDEREAIEKTVSSPAGSVSKKLGPKQDPYPHITRMLAPIASRAGAGVAVTRLVK